MKRHAAQRIPPGRAPPPLAAPASTGATTFCHESCQLAMPLAITPRCMVANRLSSPWAGNPLQSKGRRGLCAAAPDGTLLPRGYSERLPPLRLHAIQPLSPRLNTSASCAASSSELENSRPLAPCETSSPMQLYARAHTGSPHPNMSTT